MFKFLRSPRAVMVLVLGFLTFHVHAQQFQSEIKSYLTENRATWKLTTDDITDWTISDQYTMRETGVTYTYLHQQVNGIRIFNAVSSTAVRNGKVVYFASRFHQDAAHKINLSAPLITPESAVEATAGHLSVAVTAPLVQQGFEEKRQQYVFNDGGFADKSIKAELMYVPEHQLLKLAWVVTVDMKKSPDIWVVQVDAASGAVITKNNLTISCDFGAPHVHSYECVSSKKQPVAAASAADALGSTYNVYALPLEGASFGARSILTDPHSVIASPFGWHDTDGAEGAEYTITQGNNVYAYEDRDDNDTPGYSPDGGADLLFDFPLDLSQSPADNQDAIITNLFYVNNILHDILYLHGFNEVAGNFQANNYGKGGFGDDYVEAEAQDGGGTNNANFATPDDGDNGRMQMYLWPSAAPSIMKVNAPSGIAGDYVAALAVGGADLTPPVTSDAVLVDDGTATTTDACEPIVNTAAIAGKIVVIDRGDCTFVSKITAAENAGAIAVIIINNVGGAPFSVDAGGAGIPTIMISQADGNLLKAALTAGDVVNLTLFSDGSQGSDRDGSLDNGIVTHEFGHGLSNRLTGGPNNSNCLFNGEQGGEGWSDWLALILTIEPGDTGADKRGIGTYALAEPNNGSGIRRFPYSTDMGINPQTYADLAGSQEVHDIGEIWSQVLWDMTWGLIDAEGFDPDWFNGNGGNNTALRLVIEGMRLQPCGPGFLDARDAILAADDILYNNAHRCLIWESFARRGMGANANQGSAGQAGDETAGYGVPTFCQTAITTPTANFTVNVTSSCFGNFVFTDQSTDIPQEWLWDFGDGTTSTDMSPAHTYTVAGSYTVTLKVTNTLGTDIHTLAVTYAPLSTPAVTAPAVVCAGASAVLNAAVASGNNAEWTLNGAVVNTGAVFNTPVLTDTTTYMVQEFVDYPAVNVGPANNTFGTGGNHSTGFEGQLLFEAYKPVTIVSVLVYAQGAGPRTVTLYNESGAVVEAVTVNVPNGSSRITLNLDVPFAGKYSLANVSQNLYRNNAGANYPYTVNNLVSIYQSNATSTELAFYYYFYDWEVKEKGCTSAAVEITVPVKPAPIAAFNEVADQLQVNFTDISTGNPTSWIWNFGDGSPSVTQQNPSHTYAAPGTYTVVLTVSDGDCVHTFQKTVSVDVSGVSDITGAFGVQVFPNPATDDLYIQTDRILTGEVVAEMFDASGRQVIRQEFGRGSQYLQLKIATLAAGVYQVRVTGNEGTVVRKVTVL